MTARIARTIWRIGAGVVAVIAAVVCLVAVGVVVLTNTDWGHAQVRRLTLRALRGPVHGLVHIGTVSGDLLDQVVVTDVSITDSSGAPFVSARRAAVHYRLTDLLHRRLSLMDVRVNDPVVVLVQSRDSGWNYRRIFPESNTPSSRPSTGFGSHLTLANLQITGGDLTVRSPWQPDPTLRGVSRDSAIAAATGPDSRDRVSAVPGGFEKTFAVHAVTASAPAVRLADPEHPTKLFRIAALRGDVAAFRPPDATVTDVEGTFYLDNDSLWWNHAEVHLSASRVNGRGAYKPQSGDLDLALQADSAALTDLRFLDPRLPDTGGLTAGVAITWRGKRQDYVVRDLRLETGTARATGQLGMTIGDSLAFHSTDLQFAGVDTRLIEQVAPSLQLPRRGTVAGHAILTGPMSGLTVDADVTYDDSAAGVSRVGARGEVGVDAGIVDARRLALTFAPLQVALIAPSAATSSIHGTVSGHATLNGSTRHIMSAQADLVHQDGSAVTHVVAGGDVAFAPPAPSAADESGVALHPSNEHGRIGAKPASDAGHATRGFRPERVQMAATVQPLDLTEVGKLFPAARLYGEAAGGIHISGDLDDLGVHARLGVLGTPDSAVLTLDGHLHLRDTIPGYELALGAHVFNARSISHAAPPTAITATVTASGRGLRPATMATTVDAHVRASEVDSIRVDTLDLHAVAEGGQLRIDTAHARALAATLDVNGSLGLAPGRTGSLSYRLTIDSLQAWRRFLPRDTTVATMRGEALEVALERARADSAHRADSTDVERAISGAPPPSLVVDTPRAIRRDTLAGRLTTTGTVRGELHHFDLQGTLNADSVLAMGNAARHGQLLYQWSGGPGSTAPIAATARVEALTLGGFSLDSVDARITYRRPDGTVRLVVLQDSLRGYTLGALFSYSPAEKQLRYDTLAFRFDTTLWRAPHPGSVTWDSSGLTVHQVELDDGQIGRIAINGRIGRADTGGHISIALQRVSMANLAAIAQLGTPLEGEVSLRAQLDGSLQQPQLRGTASLSDATARSVPLPNVFAEYNYDTATAVTTLELAPKGAPSVPFAHMTATVPIDLALNASGSRLPDRPLSGEIKLDRVPLDALQQFESSVTGLTGNVTGRVVLTGTVRRPLPSGTLAIANGAATVTETGARVNALTAAVHLKRDSIIVDSLVARTPSTGGSLRLAGVLDRSNSAVPVANITLAATDARVLDTRDRGRLDVDANLTVAGPVAAPYIYGTTTVRDGVYYLAESNGKDIVDLTQPVVYHVVDSTQPAIHELLPTSGSLFSRLLMDVNVSVDRGTWVRNADGNVEAYTEGPLTVHIDHAHQALVVNGTVSTDVGEYRFLGKRFTITKGTATFIGAPSLNPTLSANGEYDIPDVPVNGGGPLAININITGNIDSLRLALSSNQEPPIPQSDLFSYLAFGSSTSGIGASQASSLTNSSSGNVVGTAGTFVENQLAAEAVGVVVNQLKGNLTRALDADVLDITTSNNYTDIATNWNNAAAAFFQNTQLEFGKYVTPQTYVSFQASAAPGASIIHRIGAGLSMQLSGQPLYLLGQPTLATNQVTPLTFVGGLTLVKTWKF